MKVSVIMPVFNRQDFIGTALRSLVHQRDAAELDVIVVDDGSTDGTTDVVTAFAKREPCIRLVKQENRGISNARNTGIKHLFADTELVTFLDSDDVMMADCLAMALPSFREDPDLALTYALMTVASKIDDKMLAPACSARTQTLRGIHLSAAIFRKSAIDELGGFNEKFVQAEDWDFLLRFFERPRK
jgi:glycosyltransferase involved in cell wall biosynthesis